ncbi:MAG: hypothetical protein GY731_07195 [Gammaproteobacteria bacterium]|nr:hypothetical protein [Gammaproteobacteria bacterium]
MSIVDDPMLALISSFVVETKRLDARDEEFLQQQIASMRRHVEQYPPRKQKKKALKWIETHALEYRREWQKKIVSEQVQDSKCPDCPLIENTTLSNCQIHDRWMDLLKRYLADEISSSEYVEKKLSLLEEHKERLRVALVNHTRE